MRGRTTSLALAAVASLAAWAAMATSGATGRGEPTPPPAAASTSASTAVSGFATMTPALQAMQQDDAQNPAMLWVQQGEALWRARPASGQPACAGCHAQGLAGVATRYPAFSAAQGRPVTLLQQINHCRSQRQQQPAWGNESDALLGLAAHIGRQSRGQPIAPPVDERLTPWRQAGEALYRQRMGQLNLSCAQCHDQRAGQKLAGATIPSGLATGYPLYRLEWQAMGSLPRRLRNCTTGVRAAPLDEQALTQLELYLMQRAAGLPLETPAVRP